MKKKEQLLWARARVHLKKYGIITERIENVLAPGTPDVHGTCRGRARSAFWIENKAMIKRPARPSTPLIGAGHEYSLNREQINWHLAYAQNRGRSFVLIGIGSHEALLVPGALVIELSTASYDQALAIAAAHVRWPADWSRVAAALEGNE